MPLRTLEKTNVDPLLHKLSKSTKKLVYGFTFHKYIIRMEPNITIGGLRHKKATQQIFIGGQENKFSSFHASLCTSFYAFLKFSFDFID